MAVETEIERSEYAEKVRAAGGVSQDAPITLVANDVHVRYKTVKDNSRAKSGLLRALSEKVEVNAVRGVSLVAQAGEFIGIIGRNGSGKSTLLRSLAGVEAPTAGEIWAAHRPQLLGVSAAMIPDLSGAQNVRIGCLAMGLTPAEVNEAFDRVVELSALGDAIDLPLKTYSSGMGSRLKFAISLAANPKILMIDEALATGDATFAERSKQAMNEMLEQAGTVFLVNHAAQTIETMCTRAIWLDHGVVVQDGDAVEVARKYRWFAHNLANGDDVKAMGLLRDAIEEGKRQRLERGEPATDEVPVYREQASAATTQAGETPEGHGGSSAARESITVKGRHAAKGPVRNVPREIEPDAFTKFLMSETRTDKPTTFPGAVAGAPRKAPPETTPKPEN